MKHVTWSTPVLRAEATLRAIGEQLETGTREAARAQIREHLGHMRDLIDFLNDEQAEEVRRIFDCMKGDLAITTGSPSVALVDPPHYAGLDRPC